MSNSDNIREETAAELREELERVRAECETKEATIQQITRDRDFAMKRRYQLRAKLDETCDERDNLWDKCETKEATIQHLTAELAASKQTLIDYKASQNGLMQEMHLKTARRAVEVCKGVAKKYKDEALDISMLETDWLILQCKREGSDNCADALLTEFGLDADKETK